MSKEKQIKFTFKEVAEALVQKKGLEEGKWGVGLNFITKGANIGSNEASLVPSAVLGVEGIYLFPADKDSNLTADAAEVNKPAAKKKKKKASKKKVAKKKVSKRKT